MPLNDLIPIINQLQEAFAPLGIPPIDLPQVITKCRQIGCSFQLTHQIFLGAVDRTPVPRIGFINDPFLNNYGDHYDHFIRQSLDVRVQPESLNVLSSVMCDDIPYHFCSNCTRLSILITGIISSLSNNKLEQHDPNRVTFLFDLAPTIAA